MAGSGICTTMGISMKNTMLALLAAGMLGACASQPATPRQPAPSVKPAGINPALDCGVLPVTEYLWGPAYRNMLHAKVDPDWAYPAYVGLSTGGWVLATAFVPGVDLLLLPMRLGQDCS
jgi:hypothetical protein